MAVAMATIALASLFCSVPGQDVALQQGSCAAEGCDESPLMQLRRATAGKGKAGIASASGDAGACNPAGGAYGPLPSGVRGKNISANGLTFNCLQAGTGSRGNVMLMHGFPEDATMYVGTMRKLADEGFRSIACNQRGYSCELPDHDATEYNYETIRNDAYFVAEQFFGPNGQYHLVAHDHGALMGWWMVGCTEGQRDPVCERHRRKILSYTAMSIPHPSVFSGPIQHDFDQAAAVNYFTMFSMDNNMASPMFVNAVFGAGFKNSQMSVKHFLPAMGWYKAAMVADSARILAMPKAYDFFDLPGPVNGVRAFSNTAQCFAEPSCNCRNPLTVETDTMDACQCPLGECNGYEAKRTVGKATVPVLFVCGTDDNLIKCDDYLQFTPTASSPESCPEDADFRCSGFAFVGLCAIADQEWGEWMAEHCPRACEICDPTTGTRKSTMVTETKQQTTSTYEQFVSLGCGHDLNGFVGSDDECTDPAAIQEAEQRIVDFVVSQASGRNVRTLSAGAGPVSGTPPAAARPGPPSP